MSDELAMLAYAGSSGSEMIGRHETRQKEAQSFSHSAVGPTESAAAAAAEATTVESGELVACCCSQSGGEAACRIARPVIAASSAL